MTTLFPPELAAVPEQPAHGRQQLEVLITVKAAPNPSTTYGETVCVAGVSADLSAQRWVRLYPINFRYLQQDLRFKKYDVVTVEAVPATNDVRAESWRPRMDTLRVVRHLKPWKPRRPWLDPYIEPSMCALNRAAQENPRARSLGLIRAADVMGFEVERHPGWTLEEQKKIDAYVNQLELFGEEDKTLLLAPRFKAFYRWRCSDTSCGGHRQGLIDWEFVALQQNLRGRTEKETIRALQQRFLNEICDSRNDLAFYVGNQAKRAHTFSVLGVYYPRLKG